MEMNIIPGVGGGIDEDLPGIETETKREIPIESYCLHQKSD